jgi:hypothetical protein
MNWHLFSTIDVQKFTTGDTLHLSLAPMINLNLPRMLNNEQIAIPGIPFPEYFNGQLVSYGIINNTNIGYIYLYAETGTVDQQFYQAVNALRNTQGLIIDMRLNFGGWAFFDNAFDILFNDYTLTIEDGYRAGPATQTLLPSGNAPVFQIDADQEDLYDHPIALLLGPTCISMGDLTAHRFRYHPMVKFFGKPPGASFGDNLSNTSFPDWSYTCSISDMFHVNQPGIYLNRSEFPIDFPVWHTPSAAAQGVDAVGDAARDWINSMIYAFNVTQPRLFIKPLIDTLKITTRVKNPPDHNLEVVSIINTLSNTFVDSLPMFDDGNHGDSLSGDGIYGCFSNEISTEDHFSISVSVTDLDSNHCHILPKARRFTTIGPMVLDSLIFSDGYKLGPFYTLAVELVIRNAGSTTTAGNVRVHLSTENPRVIGIDNNNQIFGDITAGQSVTSPDSFIIRFQNAQQIENVALNVNFYSDNNLLWKDSTDMVVGLMEKDKPVPTTFMLRQNYPNPFNPSTTIAFDIPKNDKVTLKVYNILGEEVTALLSASLLSGSHSVNWDAGNLASGVYLYRLEAEGFVQTRKMILMK